MNSTFSDNDNSQNEVKAIETSYKGFRFRSRLEARWAIFFDYLNIEWDYETNGFILPSGRKYLPDFKLYGFSGRGPYVKEEKNELWCDVKGVSDSKDFYDRKMEDWYKIEEFGSIGNKIIILPSIPENCVSWWNCFVTTFELVDGDCNWPCIITKPDTSDPQFVLCGGDGDSEPTNFEENLTNNALNAARSARFEFTEQDLAPLEHEVEILERRAELLARKEELLRNNNGGNQNGAI